MTDQLLQTVLNLPEADRARFAHELLLSLEKQDFDPPDEVEAAWNEEIERRLEEPETGEGALIDGDQARAAIRAAIDEVRRR